MTPSDELSLLGLKYETDKAADHWYTPHYHRRFKSFQHDPVTVLEIGIGGYENHEGGRSLKMWRDYFDHPEAKIIGLDIEEKSPIEGCFVEKGDQSDPRVLSHLIETYGPFDVVIDDGSHRPDDVLQSWVMLWDSLKDGGWYCIEDLQTSYWEAYGGSSVRTGETVIGFLQGLIDRLHYQDFDIPGYTPNRFDVSIIGLEIVRNLAFILKGDNTKPSEWMPPHPHGKVFE